ncbi:hypothetical protein AB7Y92_19640 [Providencia manganoxydans]|uniref:hypothetical protein n=1 Tax=Providencia manganoxydans TaxID=2923283 RepID=UPI0034E4D342
MTVLDFNLINIIKNAGGDPCDVTEAVWNAGYQRMDFTTEEIIQMTTERVVECLDLSVPVEVWPTTVKDLSMWDLNDIIFEALDIATPAEIAAEILKNGYRRK